MKQQTHVNSIWRQVASVIIVDLLSITSGIVSTWSSPAIPMLKQTGDGNPLGRELTVSEVSWIGSLLPLGAMFGPFVMAYCSQKIGRKWTMVGIGVIFCVAMVTMIFADNIALIYAGRAISGFSHGGVFTVVPLYLAEISKNSNRGIVGNSIGISAITGCLISYSVGPYVSFLVFNIVCLLVPATFLILAVFLPESPHYLILNGDHESACDNYLKLGLGTEEDFEDLKLFLRSKSSIPIGDIFRTKPYMRAVFMVITIASFKQLSGATTVSTYTQYIFEEAGTKVPPEISSIIVGCVEFIGGVTAPFVIDRYGRKIMLEISLCGIMAALLCVGFYFHYDNVEHLFWLPIVCLVTTKFCYGFGLVSIIWILMAEMLPGKIKSAASAILNSWYWFLQFAITYAFPLLSEALGMAVPFWIFSGFNAIGLLFVVLVVPETKGKSAEEIEEIFNRMGST